MIAAGALVFVLGTVGGIVIASLGDSDDGRDGGGSDGSTPPTTLVLPTTTAAPPTTTEPGVPSASDCQEAADVVAAANANIEQIVGSEQAGGVDYFAAILVEQRTITFAMEDVPDCFSLSARAMAAGLLEGVRNLLDAAASGSADVPLEIVPPGTGPPTTGADQQE